MRDTAQGTAFHLGEVLVSEAHIAAGEVKGYGMRRGHDLEASMAMALVDLAMLRGIQPEACAAFLEAETRAQDEADRARLRKGASQPPMLEQHEIVFQIEYFYMYLDE